MIINNEDIVSIRNILAIDLENKKKHIGMMCLSPSHVMLISEEKADLISALKSERDEIARLIEAVNNGITK